MPDDSLLYAVTTAAQRGVEVELFVGATADQFMVAHAQRSYYEALLEAGVRIWLYPEPFVLHAKHFTVDDRSRWSARATWTCGRSPSTTRS